MRTIRKSGDLLYLACEFTPEMRDAIRRVRGLKAYDPLSREWRIVIDERLDRGALLALAREKAIDVDASVLAVLESR